MTKQPITSIAHVGDVGSDRDITIRIIASAWLNEHFKFVGGRVRHDFIDLNKGRDFLTEDTKYDVVIIHYILGISLGKSEAEHNETVVRHFNRDPGFSRSSLDSPENWRNRLLGTGAEVILAFGGSSEIARVYLRELAGYKSSECFEPTPAQFAILQADRMNFLQELDDELAALSDADLLALHDEANAVPDMDYPTLPLRKALRERHRTKMIDTCINCEIMRRWAKSVRPGK